MNLELEQHKTKNTNRKKEPIRDEGYINWNNNSKVYEAENQNSNLYCKEAKTIQSQQQKEKIR